MRKVVHALRVPRLVTGILGRSREPEQIAVHDTVPVEIAHVEAEEAPVVLRSEGGITRDAWERHAWDYQPYARVDGGEIHDGEGALERLFARLTPFLLHQLKMGPYVSLDPIQHVHGWACHLADASRRRGLQPAEAVRFRDVMDDGRDAQAKAARLLSERLLVRGDDLMLRADLPRFAFLVIKVGEGKEARMVVDEGGFLRHDADPVTGKPFGCDHFRLDRPEEAEAYGGALLRDLGIPTIYRGKVEIAAPEILAACYDRAGTEAELGAVSVANDVALCMRYELAGYPDAEIARYLDLRRLVKARDGDGIRAWMEGFPATRAATEGLEAQVHDAGHAKRVALAHLDRAWVRHRTIEEPRASLASGDAAALDALGR